MKGGGELEKISELNTTRAIDYGLINMLHVTVQQAGDNSSTLGQLAMRKENGYAFHSSEARAYKQLLFV